MHINKYDFYKRITPEMREVVDHIRAWNAAHPATADWRQDYIEERKFWNEGGPVSAKTTELTVDGPNGPIPVRLHYPDTGAHKGITVYLHGGSLAMGNNDTHSRVMRTFAEESDTVVVGVDYRLAPEYRYPSWILESVAVICYFHEHGEEYGLNPNDISICGDSAGAYLTLASALYLRDHEPDISWITALILYYGTYGMSDSPSYRLWGNEIDGMMREYDTTYYPSSVIDEKDLKDPYYDLLYQDLTHDVPPCFICCGTADPLLDNSTVLYEILHDKGIPCELKLYPGVMHAFVQYTRMMEDARDALHRGGQFVRSRKTK